MAEEEPMKGDEESLLLPKKDPVTGRLHCQLCPFETNSRPSFNCHRRRNHGTIRNTLVCPVSKDCDPSCSQLELRRHLLEKHSIAEQVERHVFAKTADFLKWKERTEKEAKVAFVKNTGTKAIKSAASTSPSNRTEFWTCCRAGQKKNKHKKTELDLQKSRKQSAPRGKGTEKTGVQCPASITAKHLPNGSVEVVAQLRHVGHEAETRYLSLSETAHKLVRQKLQEGQSSESIARLLQADESLSSRDRLITAKEVSQMLRRECADLIGMFAKDDLRSIELAVTSYQKKNGDATPIFYYPPHTESSGSFALGIQTASQRQLLDQFSGNVVCLDTTHKCCKYKDYLLGTVLVLDSTGAGQPVAWFIIKGESEQEMTPIFQRLKDRHPLLRPKYFMSDCADAFFNAWKSVFGADGLIRLYCKWHVWRAWTGHIAKVADEKRRRELRQMLKSLIQSPSKEEFDLRYYRYSLVMKQRHFLLSSKNQPERTFFDYFDKEYGKNAHLWSMFGRLDCDISTNMHLESFHRTLKKRYLQRSCNRRIDYVMHILITKVAPDFALNLKRSVEMRGISTTHQKKATADHLKAKYLLENPDRVAECEKI